MDKLTIIGVILLLQSLVQVLLIVQIWQLQKLIKELPVGSRGVEYEGDGKTIKRVWIS